MREFTPSCWAFKTDGMIAEDLAKYQAGGSVGKKPRVTINIPLVVKNYVASNRRISKFSFKGIDGHTLIAEIPTRDLALIVQDQEFEVTDIRGK